jgi:hypothetical protein
VGRRGHRHGEARSPSMSRRGTPENTPWTWVSGAPIVIPLLESVSSRMAFSW